MHSSFSSISHRSRNTPVRPRGESLECRIAPATIVDARTLTFQDADGDAATVSFNRPVLTAANVDSVFQFHTGPISGDTTPQQLQKLDLAALTNGLTVTVSAIAANGGDGKVDVGFVNASGKSVAAVRISGDLGRIVVGFPDVCLNRLGELTVGSIGIRGTSTQASGGSLISEIHGSLGRLTVAADFKEALLTARARFNFITARYGPGGQIGIVKIGGSLLAHSTTPDTGSIRAEVRIGTAIVGGDLKGGDGEGTGLIRSLSIGRVSVGGSIFDGSVAAERVGTVAVTGDVRDGGYLLARKVVIGGSVNGGFVGGESSVFIGGDVIGGTTEGSGYAGGSTLRIEGNVIGGSGDYSAQIGGYRVEVLGKLTGGAGKHSASVTGGGLDNILKSLHIHGDVFGGDGERSASIEAYSIGSVVIDGSVTGGAGKLSAAMIAYSRIGSIVIGNDLTGASIAAGVWEGPDGYFNTIDDEPNVEDVRRVGTLASLTVGGKVQGTMAAGDTFAITAYRIGYVKIDGQKLGLAAGPVNDTHVLGTLFDFELVEQ